MSVLYLNPWMPPLILQSNLNMAKKGNAPSREQLWGGWEGSAGSVASEVWWSEPDSQNSQKEALRKFGVEFTLFKAKLATWTEKVPLVQLLTVYCPNWTSRMQMKETAKHCPDKVGHLSIRYSRSIGQRWIPPTIQKNSGLIVQAARCPCCQITFQLSGVFDKS